MPHLGLTLTILYLALLGPEPADVSQASTSSPPARPAVSRVLVSKSTRTMKLFSKESVVATYAVAIGKAGAGPKRIEGDNTTPVGHYHVVKRMASHLRTFMLLDYPNADDVARFQELKKRGELPPSARIGGDIGIHGEPPDVKPFDKSKYGSRGCIVLENREIDEVSAAVPDGTPVDIED